MHHSEALAYTVPFEPCFEPYVVVDKTVAPMYDERFRGYGMNKESGILFVWFISSRFLNSTGHPVLKYRETEALFLKKLSYFWHCHVDISQDACVNSGIVMPGVV